MDVQKIQLRKIRDFSEVLSDTFQFIRQEWKPLLRAFFLISGIFLLALAIVNGLYQKNSFSYFGNFDTDRDPDPMMIFRNMFGITYFIMLFLVLVAFSAMNTVVAAYMKLYESGVSAPSVPQVLDVFKKYIFQAILYNIPIFLLVLLGLIMCFAPGVYLGTVLSPFIFVVVNEDLSFGDAFGRCFTIIKDKFWPSLGIYIIMYLIVAFSAGIIGLLVGGVAGIISYFTTHDISSSVGVASSILNIFSYIFYVALFVATGFQYHSLAEKTDGTGIARRIEDIGSSENPNTHIEEQF